MPKIVARTKTCRCGCAGKDPWHARSFDRKIRDIQDVDMLADEESDAPDEVVTYRAGVARMPWGDTAVEEVGPSWSRLRWWRVALTAS